MLGRPRRKYGGASVADLDGDSWPDLLLTHHDDRAYELYWNNNGTFHRSSWHIWNDTHALSAARLSVTDKHLHFFQSAGGAYGLVPKPPAVLQVAGQTGREVRDVTSASGLEIASGRGRSVIPFHMYKRQPWRMQVVVLNAAPNTIVAENGSVVENLDKLGNTFVFDVDVEQSSQKKEEEDEQQRRPLFRQKHMPDFATGNNEPYGCAIDVDGDGHMELLVWHSLTIYKVYDSNNHNNPTNGTTFIDITHLVLPRHLHNIMGVVAVSEADYDNDGHFDLYIARTNTSDLSWLNPKHPVHDLLLRNVGGRFVDVSSEMQVPFGTRSRGVTGGDFNNDGWVDFIVPQFGHRDKDLILLNQEGMYFATSDVGFSPRVPSSARGDMATAVDFDRDGRLDLIVSEGDYFHVNRGGYYRLFRNVGDGTNGETTTSESGTVMRAISVRVGSSPNGTATGLHATVVAEREVERLHRRVGTPGTAVSVSFVECVHFGVGRWEKADVVTVSWRDGVSETRRDVDAGAYIEMGYFA